jgi:hypothetical protein
MGPLSPVSDPESLIRIQVFFLVRIRIQPVAEPDYDLYEKICKKFRGIDSDRNGFRYSAEESALSEAFRGSRKNQFRSSERDRTELCRKN